jgi:hypothetical protein
MNRSRLLTTSLMEGAADLDVEAGPALTADEQDE